ncbi:MAG: M16 family metallopeptidase [Halanaerobiales bacterium]
MKKIFNNTISMLIIIGFLLVFSSIVLAQENELFIPEIDYSFFELENGLQIYVFEDHELPLVNVAVWYKVGSFYEEEGKTGLSHVLEHSLFLGTETLEKDQVHHLIKTVGGTNNAATSYDFTVYHADYLPSAKLELAMAIEADRMRNMVLTEEEFSREMEVIRQERRMRIENNFAQAAMEEFQAAAFPESPLSHQIVGWMEDLNNLSLEDVREYYDMYYAPNNAILVVSGDADPDEVLNLAEKYYSDYQSREILVPEFENGVQDEERIIEVKKITQVPYTIMYYRIPAGNHPDKIAIDFLLEILVNNSTSRVKNELEKKQQICLYSGAGSVSFAIPGFAQVILVPADVDYVETVTDQFDNELKRLIEEGISDQELEIVKKNLLKSLIMSQRDVSDGAQMVINGLIKFDQADYYKTEIQRVLDLTKEDIVRVAKEYFIKENRTVGYILPQSAQ